MRNLTAAKVAGTADVSAAVAQALRPVGGGMPQMLTVVVNDPQRHTAGAGVLREIFRTIDPKRVRLLVAAGTHRFPEDRKRGHERSLIGEAQVGGIAWHDCRGERLVRIGGPTAGWRGHPWLLEEAPVLGIGSVEPHYFAGFTGAHKTLTIGCASGEDIERNHAHALSPEARPCRLGGNPVFEGVTEMLKSLTAARGDRRAPRAINLVQVGRRIVAAAGGTPLEALHALDAPAGAALTCRIPGPADAIVAEVTGPLGRSFYQADKGIKNCESAVRDGGAIVLAARCADGMGQDHFVALLRQADTFAGVERIVRRRGYRLGDHKAVRLRHLTDPACRGVHVYVVSAGLTDSDAAVLGLRKAASVEDALADAGTDPHRDQVFRLRDAGNTCVLVESH